MAKKKAKKSGGKKRKSSGRHGWSRVSYRSLDVYDPRPAPPKKKG
jgi:hypothetical protein